MTVINKNEGLKIAYTVIDTKITFGADELTLNLTRYQRDWPVSIDICSNRDNQLVVGTGTGMNYVAQIEIPAIEYTAATAEDVPEPIPLAMTKVTLTLWSLLNPVPAII